MKVKWFVSSTTYNKKDKKPTDYWGALFIGFLLMSAICSFLFANHTDRPTQNNVSSSTYTPSLIIAQTD